jgi:hypothetical protein
VPWTTPKTDFAPGNVLTAAQMNAIGENLNAIGGAWTAYTPTWTNITVGNGTQDSAYLNAGKLYLVRIKLTFGSTTSVSGLPEFTLPNSATYEGSYSVFTPVGLATFYDDSAGAGRAGTITPATTTTRARILINTADTTYVGFAAISSTAPWTWTTSDRIEAQFMFEAA